LIFNLATSGNFEPQIAEEQHPRELLELVRESDVRHQNISGWLTLNLSLFAEIYNGNSTTASEKVTLEKNTSGLNYIATKDVSYGFQSINYKTGLRVGKNENKFKVAPKDELLICLEGGSAGKKMGIVEQEICFGNKLFAVVCKDWVKPKYLLMYFLSDVFQLDFRSRMSGIIGGISKAKFSEILIPVPPIAEQERIIQRVEQLISICGELEEKETNLNQMGISARKSAVDAISTAQTSGELRIAWERIQDNWEVVAETPASIESLRNLILSLAISGNLTLGYKPNDSIEDLIMAAGEKIKPYLEVSEDRFVIPAHWRWVPLASIAEHQLGKMLHTAKMKGSRKKYLRSVNIRPDGTIDLSDLNEMLIPESELEKYNVVKGDIFVNEGGDVGRNAIFNLDTNLDLAFQNQLHRLRPICNIENRYIQLVLRQAKSQGVIAQMSSGVTIQHFSATSLRKFAIPLPPLSEQSLIVKQVDELMRICDQLELKMNEASQIADKFARSVVAASA
jgi:type I restriction enzyme S subunit